MTETRVEVGPAESFPEGSITAVTVGGEKLVVVRQEGEFFAVVDRCTHANFPLHDGELLDGKIKCEHHGATFDLRTGKPTLPAVKKLRLFDTAVEDGRLFAVLQEV
ncbi:MAG: Rieske 2Fe-2S domain-containing protein [Trueperaceae bacterium]